MSQRIRTTKPSPTSSTSPLKSKKKSVSIRKSSRNVVQKKKSIKKASPKKVHLEQATSLTQPRPKRLSSLTATTLLQYCTSILSPSRKFNRSILSNKTKTKQSPKDDKTVPRKRQISNGSSRSDINIPPQTDLHVPTRSRREASSRASAMILQQNEIERSRYNYSLVSKPSTSVVRRPRTKSTLNNKDNIPAEQASVESFKFNIPAVPPIAPPITNIPNQTECAPSSSNIEIKISKESLPSANLKYPLLTEASLAEHDRLHGTIPSSQTTKRDYLIKWTQELDSCERFSPPDSEHEIPLDSTNSKSTALLSQPNTKSISTSLITDSKPFNSMTSNASSRSLEHLSTANNITTPNFLFPSSAYPLDLRSFYPLLPCWQYSTWPFQSPNSLFNQTQSSSSINQKTSVIQSESKAKKLTILNSKPKPIAPIHKQKQDDLLSSSSSSKNETLTLHVHTHHHHHIHNSNTSSLLKSLNSKTTATTKIPLSEEKSSILINKDQYLEKETILKLNSNNISSTIENEVLNLSTNNKININQSNGTIKKTTRRKSSPVKRRINSGTKSNSSLTPSTGDKAPHTINSITTSPRKIVNNNQSTIIIPVSNNFNLNDNSSVDNQKFSRCIPKRRSVSATTTNSITTISIANKALLEKRTNSVSNIPLRPKSSINKKRSYSPNSIDLPLPTKNLHQRKKQKVSNYWVLFGKSEQRLVSIQIDKPPVFRECYSSIQHITEKDVINSNDCIILRSETDTNDSVAPYLAKVKWFWKEPTSDEIQMSLVWYYHPEHTQLSARAKERFLPNELLASKYYDCVNVACIEDKCYVLNLNEYNRYCLREKSINLFANSEPVGQLKSLLNKNISTIHQRPLPSTTVGHQNIFFCRYVYDYRVKRILKNPSLNNINSYPIVTTTSSM